MVGKVRNATLRNVNVDPGKGFLYRQKELTLLSNCEIFKNIPFYFILALIILHKSET